MTFFGKNTNIYIYFYQSCSFLLVVKLLLPNVGSCFGILYSNTPMVGCSMMCGRILRKVREITLKEKEGGFQIPTRDVTASIKSSYCWKNGVRWCNLLDISVLRNIIRYSNMLNKIIVKKLKNTYPHELVLFIECLFHFPCM